MKGHRPKEGESLADLFPDVASQWHPTLNGDLTPSDVGKGSDKHVWWKCYVADDHEWEARIANRSKGRGCPFCAGQKVSTTNSLATLAPHIASQWHPTKNGDITPHNVVAGSTKKVWWKCDIADDHEWETKICWRVDDDSQCPFCLGRKVSSTNSLANINPELAKQWHPTKNSDLTPSDVTSMSNKKVWWKCHVADDHEWQAQIANRATGRDCPYCAGKKASVSNSLESLFPELIKEWHPTLNGEVTPANTVAGSEKKVWWKCDVADDHVWNAVPRSRTALGVGCPACSGRQVSVTNSLQTRFPLIASEWHPTKNGNLTPELVVGMANKSAWWKCSAVPEHEWYAGINNRTNVGAGCPLCTLTPRSAQEIRLAYELSTLIDFDLEAHKVRIEGRLKDVDILLEEIRIIVEFDGSYWHRNKADKDLEKALKLEAEGWNVIRVRERPLDSIHKNDVMVETLAPVKEIADLVLQKIVEVTGVKIPKLKEYLAADEPWREKEALVAIREYQAENARKKAERDAKRKSKKKS